MCCHALLACVSGFLDFAVVAKHPSDLFLNVRGPTGFTSYRYSLLTDLGQENIVEFGITWLDLLHLRKDKTTCLSLETYVFIGL